MHLPGKRKKGETKEKIFRSSERRYGGSWCEEDGRSRQDGLEKDHTLWLPLIEGKGQIKKKKKICHLSFLCVCVCFRIPNTIQK